MYCPKCGTQLPDDASFCFECGTRIGPSGAQAGQASAAGATSSSAQQMKEIFLKLRVELDPEAKPTPTADEVIKGVKELLSIGLEGIGSVPFGVREVTLLSS